jgi:hypothetical protein
MYLKRENIDPNHTNKASVLNAMKYLAKKRPSRFTLIKKNFSLINGPLSYTLVENSDGVESILGHITYKLRFEGWN